MVKNKSKKKLSLKEIDLNSFANYLYNKKHYNNPGNPEYSLLGHVVRNIRKQNFIEQSWEEKYNLYKKKKKVELHQINQQKIIKTKNFTIGYISDIHINRKINYTKSIVENISKELRKNNIDILLIGGDTSDDLKTFKSFISQLKISILKLHIKTKIIFVLGNHELWEQAKTFNKIINKYKKVIIENGMFFIQNSILYVDSSTKDTSIKEIAELELSKISENNLKIKLEKSNLIIFGGIGFSWDNKSFEAYYGKTITDTKQLEETKKFERLYNKICDSIYNKTAIIFTHTSMEEWCKNNRNIDNFIYVNGHTHYNKVLKANNIYSDNQIGYSRTKIHIKYFNIGKGRETFFNYKDGIYEINSNDYIEFYRNKHIAISYSTEKYKGKIYMLKKGEIYCFIYNSPKNSLALLNGGKPDEKLSNSIKYYYKKMEQNVNCLEKIRKHLKKYKDFQNEISKIIIKFGGFGYIEGVNISIDWYNRIFINPIDFNITAYNSFYEDEVFYQDIEALLRQNCPSYYKNYIKQNSHIKKHKYIKIKEVENYFYYDVNNSDINDVIKKMSQKINRIYKLDEDIVCTWYKASNKK